MPEAFLNELEPSTPEVSAEDEFLLRMLYYQDNPKAATEVILEHELGGTENFIDRMIHTKTDEEDKKTVLSFERTVFILRSVHTTAKVGLR